MLVGSSLPSALHVIRAPAGRGVWLALGQHPGTGQGLAQGGGQAQHCDACFIVAAFLQRETLARGSSSWPRQKSCLPAGLEAAFCQLFVAAAFKRNPIVLVLAGGCVGRKHAPWLG